MFEFLIMYGEDNDMIVIAADNPYDAISEFNKKRLDGDINTVDIIMPIRNDEYKNPIACMTGSDHSYFGLDIAEVRFVPNDESTSEDIKEYLFPS